MGTATTRQDRATDVTSRPRAPVHTVSRPQDAAERQADRAADTVAAGGTVVDWSFLRVPPTTLHRDGGDTGGPPPQPDLDPSDEAEEARDAVLEALPQTEAGQRVIQAVRDQPQVRRIEEALTSTPALYGYGIAAAVAVALGVGATVHRAQSGTSRAPEDEIELPVQMPEVPLDFVLEGLSGRIAWEGPVDAPTNAGIVLTWRAQGAAADPEADRRREAARTERMAEELRQFRQRMRTPEQRRLDEEVAARIIAERTLARTSPTLLIPFGRARPRVVPPDRLRLEPPSRVRFPPPYRPSLLPQEQLRLDPTWTLPSPPVSRSALEQTDTSTRGEADVTGALAGGGRPLPTDLRRSMEARFGWDFGRVRLHDDAPAATAARGLRARAFTVGDHVGLDTDAVDLATTAGRRTLAHELAHVVQAGGTPGGGR